MIKIAIVDDSKSSAEYAARLTDAYLKERQEEASVKMYLSPMELLLDLDQGVYYDLYLLDVEMPVRTGIQTAHEIRKRYLDPAIIYITDHLEYSIQAFEVNAFRYIPKSELEKKLPEAYDAILPKLRDAGEKCYVLQHYKDIEVLQHRDIYCMKKEEKYVVIYHTKGEARVRKTMREVLDDLASPDFLDVGKGYAVNIRHVVALEHQELCMRSGMKVPVGRYRIEKVKEGIIRYWESGK